MAECSRRATLTGSAAVAAGSRGTPLEPMGAELLSWVRFAGVIGGAGPPLLILQLPDVCGWASISGCPAGRVAFKDHPTVSDGLAVSLPPLEA